MWKILLVGALGLASALSATLHGTSAQLAQGHDADDARPYCRKSASLAVMPSPGEAPLTAAGSTTYAASDANASNATQLSPSLLVWSGIGKHKAIFNDLYSFDLATFRWLELKAGGGAKQPLPRWKAGMAQQVPGGMVVVAGDGYLPGTRFHSYLNDVWRLDFESMTWTQAVVDPTLRAPAPRRGHSTVAFRGEDGLDRIVIFGGRTQDKTPLNEAWMVTLRWPNASWELLTPQQPQAGGASGYNQPALEAPAPRKGHTATLLPSGEMLVYGGREDNCYYGDLHLLDIKAKRWRRIQPPAGGHAPPARDHHTAVFFRGKLVVWGGRSGRTYRTSKPMNDLWLLDVNSWTWREVPQQGRVPLPRFEESYLDYSPPGMADSRLLIFGGQAAEVCQLNDVWELNLDTLTWAELDPPHFCTDKCRQAHGQS